MVNLRKMRKRAALRRREKSNYFGHRLTSAKTEIFGQIDLLRPAEVSRSSL